ncbi:hypothetical protein PRK78_007423 [Emydomyces testavorans]|uniref:FAD-binding PCMH-type domain-containing protein n=1 Tax=Emydomyces testavorans TaxID=2070801 RepID=A0AAF0DPA4_9EURO|nr:hypothetical protein PRK78_007423 [Emydomyces testavorans]
MLLKPLSTWLLPTAAISATALQLRTQDYVPQSLNDTIKELGLEEYMKHLPNFNEKKRDEALASRCSRACNTLRDMLHSEVQFPGLIPYAANKGSYWAKQQSDLSPSCFLAAKGSRSVAMALTVSQKTQCPFAVRGGGHSIVPGASNTDVGITIDLRAFDEVKLSGDKKIVSVGPGATWLDVYKVLDQHDLTVVGGRASTVGVSGLTLGGGISFISGRGGFACDNIMKYQVMMADGQVLDVDYNSHPLLYFALRGGGNNFGVVLRFDFETFPLGKLWGGKRTYDIAAKEAINSGLSSYNDNASDDPDLAIITTFIGRRKNYFSLVFFDYAKPQADPPILKSSFKDLYKFRPTTDTTRFTNMSDLVLEIGLSTPRGFRQRFATLTYKNSVELQNNMVDIFMEEVKKIEDKVFGPEVFLPVIAFQPVPTTVSSKFSKRGGNALGVSASDGPLIGQYPGSSPIFPSTQTNHLYRTVVNLAFQWTSPVDDRAIELAMDRTVSRTNEIAMKKGLSYDYLYTNYAAPNQKPMTSYGAANVRKLREAQAKYDPQKVFEQLQPGGFKLNM